MKWTKQKPNDFRWYWYRESEGEYEGIVHLFSHSLPSKNTCVRLEWVTKNIKEMNGDWAGPIEKPNEAKK